MLELPLEPPEPDYYECPCCGAEIPVGTFLYYDESGNCVGCEECITMKFVEDVAEDEKIFWEESWGKE